MHCPCVSPLCWGFSWRVVEGYTNRDQHHHTAHMTYEWPYYFSFRNNTGWKWNEVDRAASGLIASLVHRRDLRCTRRTERNQIGLIIILCDKWWWWCELIECIAIYGNAVMMLLSLAFGTKCCHQNYALAGTATCIYVDVVFNPTK